MRMPTLLGIRNRVRLASKGLVLPEVSAAAERHGFNLSDEPTLMDFLTSWNVDLVIDVGANEGQFATELRGGGYSGHIMSFEPITAVHAILKKNSVNDPKWTVHNSAIGEVPGVFAFNVSKNSVYSSFNNASRYGIERDALMEITSREDVQVRRLDGVEGVSNFKRIFLKIDTQGFERQVLASATMLYDKLAGIQLELPVSHLYEGVWTFHEALKHMHEIGFVPAQFRTVCDSPEIPASAVEFDCVFRKL